MPNFNKSKGFKMSGYSYPGKSPMKGKRKDADLAAAAEGQATATAKMEEFGDMKMESTDILGKGKFKVDAGSSPATKRSPAKNWLGAAAKVVGNAAKDFAKSDLGKEAGKAVVGGTVSAGINAIGKKKEKPKKVAADQSGFAGIQFGSK
tara:strand:+ start:458 stop:904 length:447 start_codon:yes stop_codon:yes gene_type:complete